MAVLPFFNSKTSIPNLQAAWFPKEVLRDNKGTAAISLSKTTPNSRATLRNGRNVCLLRIMLREEAGCRAGKHLEFPDGGDQH